jgi:hypothetical protein
MGDGDGWNDCAGDEIAEKVPSSLEGSSPVTSGFGSDKQGVDDVHGFTL